MHGATKRIRNMFTLPYTFIMCCLIKLMESFLIFITQCILQVAIRNIEVT